MNNVSNRCRTQRVVWQIERKSVEETLAHISVIIFSNNQFSIKIRREYLNNHINWYPGAIHHFPLSMLFNKSLKTRFLPEAV